MSKLKAIQTDPNRRSDPKHPKLWIQSIQADPQRLCLGSLLLFTEGEQKYRLNVMGKCEFNSLKAHRDTCFGSFTIEFSSQNFAFLMRKTFENSLSFDCRRRLINAQNFYDVNVNWCISMTDSFVAKFEPPIFILPRNSNILLKISLIFLYTKQLATFFWNCSVVFPC